MPLLSHKSDPTPLSWQELAASSEELLHRSHPAFRSVSVSASESELVLSGRLPSYYFKQMAQTLVADCQHEVSIVNQIVVKRLKDTIG